MRQPEQPPDYSRDLRRQKRKNPTPAEKLLWTHLRNGRLDGLKFRRQHPFGRYIVDFYCHAKRLLVEIDGPIHEQRIDDDQIRQSDLESAGYSFLRFSNDEVLNSIGRVLATISKAAQSLEGTEHGETKKPVDRSPSPTGRGKG